MSTLLGLSVSLGLIVPSACGGSGPSSDSEEPTPSSSNTVEDRARDGTTSASATGITSSRAATDGALLPVTPGEVRLWVSNQSFEDDPVTVVVEVDGTVVVDESFRVGNQHNWTAFDIAGLEPGQHKIVATSGTGARTVDTFDLPPNESRWLVVDYWYYPDDAEGRFLTLSESDEPVAFA